MNVKVHQARHYAELLKAASREYFLIVMLRADESHQFLTYEAPLIPAVRSSTARRRAWKALLPFSTEFTVDYVTQIPGRWATLRLTFTVPYGKHAERLAFESAMAAIASEQGVDLYRADRRPDAGQGDWEPVTEPRSATGPWSAVAVASKETHHRRSHPVLVPLTFIGRRGEEGVGAFLKLAEVLKEGRVRVAALTASVMGQHAVVNVLAEGRRVDDSAVAANQPYGMVDALDAMLAHGIVETRFWDPQEIKEGIAFEVCIGVAPGETLPQPKAVQSQLVYRLREELPSAPPYSVFLHVVWTEPWLTRRRGT